MTAEISLCTVVSLFFCILFSVVGCQDIDFQLCRNQCPGTVQNGSAVWEFCLSSYGQVDGRCCFQKDNFTDNYIIGLDLSNCSLTNVDLQEATTAIMIDLSINPMSNLSDLVFQGLWHLDHLRLPSKLACPGGNASWVNVEVKGQVRLCDVQINICNQTGQLSLDCPENSQCMPYGPGFFECSCADNFHGYKCLREGQFPMLEVFGILGGSTVLASALLWVTQRRKAKAI